MGHSDARRRGSEEVCGDPSSDMQTQQGGGGVLKDCKTPTSHAVAQGGDMHQCTRGLGRMCAIGQSTETVPVWLTLIFARYCKIELVGL